MDDVVARLLAVWRASDADVRDGASAQAIAEAERRLGRVLPDEVRHFYAAMDGGDFEAGDLRIDDVAGLAGHSDESRDDYDWPVPDEVVAFGSGGGNDIGLWLPREGRAAPLVVAMTEVDIDLAIIADGFLPALVGLTAYYASWAEPELVVQVLGLPAELAVTEETTLRATFGDDPNAAEGWSEEDLDAPAAGEDPHRFARIMRWASPGLHPTRGIDPWEDPVPVDEVRRTAVRQHGA